MNRADIRAAAVEGLDGEPEVREALSLASQTQALVDEYNRRNTLCAKAYGACEDARYALDRLARSSGCPLWLWDRLNEIERKTEPLGKALAQWRDGK